MFLSDVSIKRPVFATMMMVALVVLGVVSYRRLAIDEYPDVTYPTITVQTSYPGASPEVMMRQVSKPLEEALNTVQGIKEINSSSYEGGSQVRLSFNLGVDIGVAQQDVQAKVARIRRSLPPNIEDPIIQHFDPNDSPIMSIALQSSERPLREITDLADQVVTPRFEAFADIAVAVRNGVPIKLGDVGTVIDGSEERRTAAEIDGSPSVTVDVLKIAESNTVAVADSVRVAVRDLEKVLPQDVKVTVRRDDSERIRESLADVQNSIVLGALLTIAIIYLFLNSWRSTVITGLTLPVSIISAFFVMWLFGFTVNTMTLLALSLAIGLLIDDAIVVRENIVRHVEMGKDHYRAAKEGTDEIGLAVAATSLAVVAVFFPVAFMGGMIGKIFFQFGVTVAFAVLVSLFVSFTLDPMLSSVWPDPEIEGQNHGAGPAGAARAEPTRRRVNPIRRFAFWFNDGFERLADRYPQWLQWALGHRWIVVG